ncbi:hypothetical protein BB560_004789 [Smittium megazygosporum]|uniref:Structural maintenance of chromosomes protein n=1 Tax=Smittium megazygosporum TaxID=133381 RepID=A0A2T9Z887_9FUNG|nr:hypothetical protein BB560_004789 [Smittium megazygosporum]
MGREERQALLYEGAGSATMSAFVEIVFDNSDQRFPTGKEDTVVRRTVGLKKDEYSIDKKGCARADVMNLLESAGFSKSNPYYIVPQGRITSLTLSKDSERLELLKELAGTKIYDNKRDESLRILTETNSKHEKIIELLDSIEEKLNELEKEQEDLKKFQELDKERRCLEYAIYNTEQTQITEQLEEAVNEYNNFLAQTSSLETELSEAENQLKEIKSLEEAETQKNEILLAERQYLLQSLELAVTKRLKLQTLKNSAENEFGGKKEIDILEKKLAKAIDQQNRTKERLNQIQDSLDNLNQELYKSKLDLTNSENRYQELTRKSEKFLKFKTINERNNWIDARILQIGNRQKSLETSIVNYKKEQDQVSRSVQTSLESSKAHDLELKESNEQLRELKKELDSKLDSRNELIDSRKELWRNEAKIEAEIKDLNTKKDESQRNLLLSVERNVSLGLQSLNEIVDQLGLADKVYGPIYELFDIEEDYRLAADAVAGSNIFHIVVEDEVTATTIVEQLQKLRSGRLTFVPLNRLNIQSIRYPDAGDCVSLISKLTFDPKFLSVMQQVFGKSIICSTLEVAAGYARSHGLISVTLDGDRTDYSGVFSGGLVSSSKTRLEQALTYKQLSSQTSASTSKLSSVKNEIKELSQKIKYYNTTLQENSSKQAELLDQNSRTKAKIIDTKKELAALESQLQGFENSLTEANSLIEAINQEIRSLEKEKTLPLSSKLTAEEEQELDQLMTTIQSIQRDVSQFTKEISEKEENRNQLSNLLSELLEPRVAQFSSIVSAHNKSFDYSSNTGITLNLVDELDKAISEEKKIKSDLAEIDKNLENYNEKINAYSIKKENDSTKRDKLSRQLNSILKESEMLVSRRQILNQRLDECTSNIRMLGVLPDEAFEKYIDVDYNQLLRKIKKVNNQLRDYGHVNKKAVDQFNSFSRQKDDLVSRESELEASYDSITSLIKSLDQRKEEAIERTFKSVAKSFSEVFEVLVPAGKGKLVMQRDSSNTNSGNNIPVMIKRQDKRRKQKGGSRTATSTQEQASQERSEGASEYIGVSIKVSFNSKNDEGLRMQQLSGGQKSLVALALIFAIQRCDPAPFYLFDEIDANLDAVYRTAVAKMIHNQSKDCQFITTTFRPEMLLNADKFYGVTFANKVSNISTITKENALTFVEQELVSNSDILEE